MLHQVYSKLTLSVLELRFYSLAAHTSRTRNMLHYEIIHKINGFSMEQYLEYLCLGRLNQMIEFLSVLKVALCTSIKRIGMNYKQNLVYLRN